MTESVPLDEVERRTGAESRRVICRQVMGAVCNGRMADTRLSERIIALVYEANATRPCDGRAVRAPGWRLQDAAACSSVALVFITAGVTSRRIALLVKMLR